ncbi:hypothetical protein T552_01246 [Pneumocystis carinii B80]|uniref:Thioredoxin domain-containing protein n=1 Tax=Pneumocystis carinii (strain B80) TaxID=1408658 RepID=A0A0W4ZLN8_PNEC8|nr:hypothetical protein T552_01246 [Pneumocystis carinii B80]KTW29291.1 hypothetical protein T552_01246 [Pneumocystis carinii B80]
MLWRRIFISLFLHLYVNSREYKSDDGGNRDRFFSYNLSEQGLPVLFSGNPYSSGIKSSKRPDKLEDKAHSVELTPEAFSSGISSLWLINFYSSECHDSKLFGFYWKEAVDRAYNYNRNEDFYFGNVNCFLYEKLCLEFGVENYPKILLFDNGQLKEEFKLGDISEKNVQDIVNYMKEKTKKISSLRFKKVLKRSVSNLRLKAASKRAHINPNGQSIDLIPQNFVQLVTKGNSGWFIKYHLPYCPHCKIMKADWDKFALLMKGLLNVGEVDCSKYTSFCKDKGISGVPTMIYYKGTYSHIYKGSRKAKDFKKFSHGIFLSMPSSVHDLDTYSKYSSRFMVFFIYFYPELTSEDKDIIKWMSVVLIGKTPLLKIPKTVSFIKESSGNYPSILVFRENFLFSYPFRNSVDLKNKTRILNWMKLVWYPLFPRLTKYNYKDIMQNDFVIIIILYNPNEYKAKKQIVTSIIETWKAQYLNRFINKESGQHYSIQYVWVDGRLWRAWLYKTFKIKYGITKVIIQKKDIFWDKNLEGSYIKLNKKDILETLSTIMQDTNKIKPIHLNKQATISEKPSKNYTYIVIIVFVVIAILLMILLGFILKKTREKRQREEKNAEPLESRFE